jgi:hypothetical protein
VLLDYCAARFPSDPSLTEHPVATQLSGLYGAVAYEFGGKLAFCNLNGVPPITDTSGGTGIVTLAGDPRALESLSMPVAVMGTSRFGFNEFWILFHQATRVRDVMIYTDASSVRVSDQLGGFGLAVVKHRVRLPNFPNRQRLAIAVAYSPGDSVLGSSYSDVCLVQNPFLLSQTC